MFYFQNIVKSKVLNHTTNQCYLVAVLHISLEDACEIIYVQTSICPFFQSHGVTQNNWQGLSLVASSDRVGAVLTDTKTFNQVSSTYAMQAARDKAF